MATIILVAHLILIGLPESSGDVQINQQLWDAVMSINTETTPKLTKSILPQARCCQALKLIERNELYKPLNLYTVRIPLQKEQVCPLDVDIMWPRFPAVSPYPVKYSVNSVSNDGSNVTK